MSEKELLLIVEAGTGRQLIGERVDLDDKTVTLGNPLLILERVLPPQQGQRDDQQQIILNISPIMHTFVIDKWKFKWSGYHEVNDEKLKSTYEEFTAKVRASRSGIELSPAMPGLSRPHLV